jgi:hypothetical protein
VDAHFTVLRKLLKETDGLHTFQTPAGERCVPLLLFRESRVSLCYQFCLACFGALHSVLKIKKKVSSKKATRMVNPCDENSVEIGLWVAPFFALSASVNFLSMSIFLFLLYWRFSFTGPSVGTQCHFLPCLFRFPACHFAATVIERAGVLAAGSVGMLCLRRGCWLYLCRFSLHCILRTQSFFTVDPSCIGAEATIASKHRESP